MSYQFLLFDLDHTLLDFASDEESALTTLLVEAGVSNIAAYKAYYIPMNQVLWQDLSAGLITKKELIDTRFAKLFAHFGQEVDGRDMAERYQHFLSQEGHVFPGVRDFLQTLREQGYHLFGATNGVTYIQKGRLAQSQLVSFFDHVFISDELGAHKPEKAFFTYIANTIPGFEAQKALMIGDSLLADIKGGQDSGIDTIWYNPENQANTTSVTPTYIAQNYQDILDIIRRGSC